jgi:hypothetical protein
MIRQKGFPVPKVTRWRESLEDSHPEPEMLDYKSWTDFDLKDEMFVHGVELPTPWSAVRGIELLVALHLSDIEKHRDRQDRKFFDKGLNKTWELPVASLELKPVYADMVVRPQLATRQKRMFASTLRRGSIS